MTQGVALTILKTGANVFLTGEPGSGKTHTINAYVSWLRRHGIEPAITASTGIAATHIGGLTIHSWSGIGVRESLSEYDLDHIQQNERLVKRIRETKILIIDEISMLSSNTLRMVDEVCRTVRNNQHAFGGMQVILVGDFFQLPPIVRQGQRRSQQEELFVDDEPHSIFAFGSRAWKSLNPIVCYLTEQHRQADAVFLELLNAIRIGAVEDRHQTVLASRKGKPAGANTTNLYSHNADVDRINTQELEKIQESGHVYQMTSQGSAALVEGLKRGCLSPETLALRTGARVMFTKNDINQKYVNGTTGVVTGFVPVSHYPIITTTDKRTVVAEPAEWSIADNGRILARINQVPLRLAWAITVHKSQGMSLDAAHMDLSSAFEYGQGYVALSRARSLAGLTLVGWNARALEVHPEIREQDEVFREASGMAEDTFEKFSEAEVRDMHERFIRACDGVLEEREVTAKSRFKKPKVSTYDQTLALLKPGIALEDIADARGMTVGTIVSHLEKLSELKKIDLKKDFAHLKPEQERFEKIVAMFKKLKTKDSYMALAPVRSRLGSSYSFEEIRLARLFID